MNLKIALAALTLIAGGSYVANAQQKAGTTQSAANLSRKSFEAKISAYQKETSKDKADALFKELNTMMVNDFTSRKAELVGKGPESKEMALFQAKVTAVRAAGIAHSATPENKAEVVEALKKYAQTL